MRRAFAPNDGALPLRENWRAKIAPFSSRQARAHLIQGDLDLAEKETNEAVALQVEFAKNEDSPARIFADLTGARVDAKALLKAARAALQGAGIHAPRNPMAPIRPQVPRTPPSDRTALAHPAADRRAPPQNHRRPADPSVRSRACPLRLISTARGPQRGSTRRKSLQECSSS